jgi:hypothetical protein
MPPVAPLGTALHQLPPRQDSAGCPPLASVRCNHHPVFSAQLTTGQHTHAPTRFTLTKTTSKPPPPTPQPPPSLFVGASIISSHATSPSGASPPNFVPQQPSNAILVAASHTCSHLCEIRAASRSSIDPFLAVRTASATSHLSAYPLYSSTFAPNQTCKRSQPNSTTENWKTAAVLCETSCTPS